MKDVSAQITVSVYIWPEEFLENEGRLSPNQTLCVDMGGEILKKMEDVATQIILVAYLCAENFCRK